MAGQAEDPIVGPFRLRELLDPAYDPVIELPPDDLLLGEVTEPHWMQTSNGLVQIESKDGIKKRLHRSTDRADAVVMAWWQDRERRQARMGDIRLSPPPSASAASRYGEPIWIELKWR